MSRNSSYHPSIQKNSDTCYNNKQATKILIIYGDQDAGSGGQRHNEFKTYLEGMGYEVNTTHTSTFSLDPSVANNYNLLIIDRSMTANYDVINATGRPILALGYGGGLYFTNSLGFPTVSSEGTWYDNNHRILNSHVIYNSPNFIGSSGNLIQPVYYGPSYYGDGREYHFQISGLLPGSIALLDYFWENSERSTRTVLFAYNVTTTQKTIFWGYNSYYLGYGNWVTNPLGLNLLQNIVEYLKVPVIVESEFEISNVNQTPLIPIEYEAVTINATITSKSNITEATIYYKVNDGSYNTQGMVLTEGSYQNGIWQGTIPSYPYLTNVSYSLCALNQESKSIKTGLFNYTVSESNPPLYYNLTQIPSLPLETDQVQINVTLNDLSGIKNAKLLYYSNTSISQIPKSLVVNDFNVSNFQSENLSISSNEPIKLALSGNYLANFSFTNDPVGGDPVGWSVSEGLNTVVQVVNSFISHNKTVLFYDDTTSTTPCYMDQFFTGQIAGTVELWVGGIIGSANLDVFGIELWSGASIAIHTVINYSAGINQYYNYRGGAPLDQIIVSSPNFLPYQWHHILIDFNCSSDTFECYVDGMNKGTFDFRNAASSITSLRLGTGNTETAGGFGGLIDAVDYSWSPNYFRNRNFNNTFYETGYYQSSIYDLGVGDNYLYQTLEFGRTTELATNTSIEYRTSPNNSTWSSWSSGFSNNLSINALKDRFFQFCLNLSASGNFTNTPEILWVNLSYLIWNSTGWNSENLDLLQGSVYNGIWNGTIPAFSNGTIVKYYLDITDTIGNRLLIPSLAPVELYGYIVGGQDSEAPPIIATSAIPSFPTYQDYITITALIDMDSEISALENVSLCYTFGTQPLNYCLMNFSNFVAPNYLNFTAHLPPFSYHDIIYYNITSYDNLGNSYSTITYNFTISDLIPPEFILFNQNPSRPNTFENVQINVSIHEPNLASGVKNATIYYNTNELSYIGIESLHPVPDLYSHTWNLSSTNGIIETLYFENISLEDGFDFLYIYNGSFGLLDTLTGDINRYDIQIHDSTALIQISTDMVIKSWGFFLSRMKIRYDTQSIPLVLSSGDQYNGIWSVNIPAKQNISVVNYYVQTFDYSNNSKVSSKLSYVSAEKIPPIIQNIAQTPSNTYIKPSTSPVITATISDLNTLYYKDSVILQYTSGSLWNNLSMTYLGDSYFPHYGQWSSSISEYLDGTKIVYRVIAHDLANNTVISSNYTYICDGSAPSLKAAKFSPFKPNCDENVIVSVNLTDCYPLDNGAGVDSVSVEYSYLTTYNLESSHPYLDNSTQTWFVSDSTAIGFSLHFSTIILSAGDYITVCDAQGSIKDLIFMSIDDYWTPLIYSNNISINLNAATLGNAWGFKIDFLLFYKNISCQLTSGTIYAGTWQGSLPCFPFDSQIWFEVIACDKVANEGTIYTDSYIVDDTISPQIVSLNISTNTPTPSEDLNITLQIIESGSGIQNISLFLSVDGGISWHVLLFQNISDAIWICTIPKQPDNTLVKYYIIAYDKNDNAIRNPNLGYFSLIFKSPTQPPDNSLWIILVIASTAAILGVVFYFYSHKSLNKKKLEIISKKYHKPKIE